MGRPRFLKDPRTVSFALPAGVEAELRRAAAARRVKVSQVYRDAVRLYLAARALFAAGEIPDREQSEDRRVRPRNAGSEVARVAVTPRQGVRLPRGRG